MSRESTHRKRVAVQQLARELLQYAKDTARDGEPIHKVERAI